VSPHQLIDGVLPAAVAVQFDELFVGPVDHFGDCLFRGDWSGEASDHRSVRFLATIAQPSPRPRCETLILFQ
jgi:hypothetical protein